MKHDKNHDNGRVTGSHLVPVHFEFTHPTAITVRIGGTFNDWRPEAKPMHPMWDGRWLKETVLASGTYEYCLAVDGRWLSDPLVKETVANPIGEGTPFLGWPAHLKHLTPPVRDFYN